MFLPLFSNGIFNSYLRSADMELFLIYEAIKFKYDQLITGANHPGFLSFYYIAKWYEITDFFGYTHSYELMRAFKWNEFGYEKPNLDLFKEAIYAMRVFNILNALVFLTIFFFIIKNLTNLNFGLISTLVISSIPSFVTHTLTVRTELLSMTFLLVCFYLMIKILKNRSKFYLINIFFIGLFYIFASLNKVQSHIIFYFIAIISIFYSLIVNYKKNNRYKISNNNYLVQSIFLAFSSLIFIFLIRTELISNNNIQEDYYNYRYQVYLIFSIYLLITFPILIFNYLNNLNEIRKISIFLDLNLLIILFIFLIFISYHINFAINQDIGGLHFYQIIFILSLIIISYLYKFLYKIKIIDLFRLWSFFLIGIIVGFSITFHQDRGFWINSVINFADYATIKGFGANSISENLTSYNKLILSIFKSIRNTIYQIFNLFYYYNDFNIKYYNFHSLIYILTVLQLILLLKIDKRKFFFVGSLILFSIIINSIFWFAGRPSVYLYPIFFMPFLTIAFGISLYEINKFKNIQNSIFIFVIFISFLNIWINAQNDFLESRNFMRNLDDNEHACSFSSHFAREWFPVFCD